MRREVRTGDGNGGSDLERASGAANAPMYLRYAVVILAGALVERLRGRDFRG